MNSIYEDQDRKQKKSRGTALLIILLLAVIGFNIYRFMVDKSNFDLALDSLSKNNCSQASDYFNKVTSVWRMFDFNKYANTSARGKHVCNLVGSEKILPTWMENIERFRTDLTNPEVLVTFATDQENAYFDEITKKVSTLDEGAKCQELIDIEDTLPGLDSASSLYPRLKTIFNIGEDCVKIHSAEKNESANKATAFKEYTEFLKDNSTENAKVQYVKDRIKAMIVKNSIEDLVSYDFCQFLSSDSDTALIFSTQEKIRNAYLSCANMNQDSDLLAVYLDQYQDDPNKGVVEEKYAEMLIDNAKKENTGTLSLPPVSGKTASGKSEIRVTNATDQSIRIVLKGPDTVIKEMEKCTWCTDYNNIGPATCPSTDSETTISLKPAIMMFMLPQQKARV